MIDYNDGNWHGWSGGECPVHMESRIDHVWHDDNIKQAGITKGCLAGAAAWGQTLKFRVTKPYVEPKKPREWWIDATTNVAWDDKELACDVVYEHLLVHVREVLGE